MCEDVISIYKKATTGIPERCSCISRTEALEEGPQHPGSTLRRPLWVNWARPVRHSPSGWNSTGNRYNFAFNRPRMTDDFYLAREDGVVQYCTIPSQTSISDTNWFDRSSVVGHFDCYIGSAFACLCLGVSRSDVLAIGADMSSGGLYRVAFPRHHYTRRTNTTARSDLEFN